MANETIADILREMRGYVDECNRGVTAHTRYGNGVFPLDDLADRIKAARKREVDSIHRAMVILAGIEMEDSTNPPRLWTALEDAYDALSDTLGMDGETTADVEEAVATGRHFVVRMLGNNAKIREALAEARKVIKAMGGYWARETLPIIDSALDEPPRNCDVLANAQKALDAIHDDRCYVQNPVEERKLTVEWLFAEAKGEVK